MNTFESARPYVSLHQVQLRHCRPYQISPKYSYSARNVIRPFDHKRSGNAFDTVHSISKLTAMAGVQW